MLHETQNFSQNGLSNKKLVPDIKRRFNLRSTTTM